MLQWLLRAILATIGFLIFFYALPLVLSLLGVSPPAALLALLKLAGAAVALWYIVWGPPVPLAW